MKTQHNFKVGPIKKCQICNSKNIQKVMDFGYQPLADDLIHFNDVSRKSVFYPLEVFLCAKCTLLQTGYIVEIEHYIKIIIIFLDLKSSC